MNETIIKKIDIDDTTPGNIKLRINGLTMDELVPEVLDQIVDKLKLKLKNNLFNITLDCQADALPPNPLIISSSIIKKLNEKFPNSYKNYIIGSAGTDTTKNYEAYKKIAEKYNLVQADIKFLGTTERAASFFITAYRDFYEQNFKTDPKIKLKKFLCLNHNLRVHRLYLVSKILENNLLNDSYVSFLLRGDALSKIDKIVSSQYLMKATIPNFNDKVRDTLLENIDLFPIELNWFTEEDFRLNTSSIVNDVEYYNESYFSVVTESIFFKELPYYFENQFDCIYFSEKTWKPIQAKHPFILVTRPGSLKVLQELGYKTFAPYIDENYDLIEDDELRLEAIFSEIMRLSKFTNDQWLEWQENVKEIVEHNFNHCIERWNHN